MAKLGQVVNQGCYKDGDRLSGASGNIKYLHNCTSAGGDEVRWTFEVLNDNDEVIGHIEAVLPSSFNGDETAQKAKIREIATGLLPD
ncbi:MAG: hypothetical protein AAFQ01_04320 [Bacteroidota bacterium]